jgi:hypothetical protein
MTRSSKRACERLVDLRHGVVSRDIFVDADLYHQEQEQIFARAWLLVVRNRSF